jgi:hypothetical protein
VLARQLTPDFFSVLGAQQLDPQAMDAILRELPGHFPAFATPYLQSRDYYPYLEYATPRGYALPDSVEQQNLSWIRSYDRHELPKLLDVPNDAERSRIELLAAAGSGDCARLRKLGGAASADDSVTRAARQRCVQQRGR